VRSGSGALVHRRTFCPPQQEDHRMSYLRFAPAEYQAVTRVAARLDAPPLHTLKKLLVAALAADEPALAARIGRLKAHHMRLLHEHLWSRPRHFPQCPLTPEEVVALVKAFGPLLMHSRFQRPLKRALVLHLLQESPELGHKLHALSPEEFAALCSQVRQSMRGG
jgi:hypothetical protein